jgi:phosphatidylserine synthase
VLCLPVAMLFTLLHLLSFKILKKVKIDPPWCAYGHWVHCIHMHMAVYPHAIKLLLFFYCCLFLSSFCFHSSSWKHALSTQYASKYGITGNVSW